MAAPDKEAPSDKDEANAMVYVHLRSKLGDPTWDEMAQDDRAEMIGRFRATREELAANIAQHVLDRERTRAEKSQAEAHLLTAECDEAMARAEKAEAERDEAVRHIRALVDEEAVEEGGVMYYDGAEWGNAFDAAQAFLARVSEGVGQQ